jgi:1-acyl-sn-glycerol-3-phosphate acyltransferase/long-chain acyl-CoA synthetase
VNSIQSELESTVLSPGYFYILEKPSLVSRSIKKIFEIYCKILFKIYCPLKVEGKENIPASSFIFCSNHNSHMDSGVLMVSSGIPFKNFAMMAAKDYFFDNEKRKYYLNLLMNLIPVDRDADRKSMIEYLVACREFTRGGKHNLIIYPEGTRSLTGKIQPFKKGPAMVATELGLPIVPAYIEGTRRAWPKGKIFMKPKKISIRIGKAIHPADFKCKEGNSEPTNFVLYKKITEELERSVNQLMKAEEIEK